jgi:hypothetical protein
MAGEPTFAPAAPAAPAAVVEPLPPPPAVWPFVAVCHTVGAAAPPAGMVKAIVVVPGVMVPDE